MKLLSKQTSSNVLGFRIIILSCLYNSFKYRTKSRKQQLSHRAKEQINTNLREIWGRFWVQSAEANFLKKGIGKIDGLAM